MSQVKPLVSLLFLGAPWFPRIRVFLVFNFSSVSSLCLSPLQPQSPSLLSYHFCVVLLLFAINRFLPSWPLPLPPLFSSLPPFPSLSIWTILSLHTASNLVNNRIASVLWRFPSWLLLPYFFCFPPNCHLLSFLSSIYQQFSWRCTFRIVVDFS